MKRRLADWQWIWLPAAVFAPCMLIGLGMAMWP
jgi:hypothetical protein